MRSSRRSSASSAGSTVSRTLPGVLGDLSPIDQYDVPTWCKVLHVNLTAAFIVTRTLLPLLRHSEDASIVFTSSTIARGGRAYWGAYAASKFGVEGLMQVLAHEMADTTHVRVNSLNPGPVRTAMRRQAFPAEDPGRLPEPAAIVAPYLYLLGPAEPGHQRRGARLPVAPMPALSRSAFNSASVSGRLRPRASARSIAIGPNRVRRMRLASRPQPSNICRNSRGRKPRDLHLKPAIAAFTAGGHYRRYFSLCGYGAGAVPEASASMPASSNPPRTRTLYSLEMAMPRRVSAAASSPSVTKSSRPPSRAASGLIGIQRRPLAFGSLSRELGADPPAPARMSSCAGR